jgi:hypothetical protein
MAPSVPPGGGIIRNHPTSASAAVWRVFTRPLYVRSEHCVKRFTLGSSTKWELNRKQASSHARFAVRVQTRWVSSSPDRLSISAMNVFSNAQKSWLRKAH